MSTAWHLIINLLVREVRTPPISNTSLHYSEADRSTALGGGTNNLYLQYAYKYTDDTKILL